MAQVCPNLIVFKILAHHIEYKGVKNPPFFYVFIIRGLEDTGGSWMVFHCQKKGSLYDFLLSIYDESKNYDFSNKSAQNRVLS